MKLAEVNDWLTLVANLGVLAGIIFLGFEIQQTRTALIGDFHSNRADRSNEITLFFTENNLAQAFGKHSNGVELSPEELNAMGGWAGLMLRHFEDIQFQRDLGLVDDEVWESNLRAMKVMVDSAAFQVSYPDWPVGNPLIDSFRTSFVEHISDIKAELE